MQFHALKHGCPVAATSHVMSSWPSLSIKCRPIRSYGPPCTFLLSGRLDRDPTFYWEPRGAVIKPHLFDATLSPNGIRLELAPSMHVRYNDAAIYSSPILAPLYHALLPPSDSLLKVLPLNSIGLSPSRLYRRERS